MNMIEEMEAMIQKRDFWATPFRDKIIRDCIAIARKHMAEVEWQRIESAPRDGTEILVYYETATVPIVHIAWWKDDEYDEWEAIGYDSKEQMVGWWSYVNTSVSQHKLENYSSPTHWMPLPAPPKPDTVINGDLTATKLGDL